VNQLKTEPCRPRSLRENPAVAIVSSRYPHSVRQVANADSNGEFGRPADRERVAGVGVDEEHRSYSSDISVLVLQGCICVVGEKARGVARVGSKHVLSDSVSLERPTAGARASGRAVARAVATAADRHVFLHALLRFSRGIDIGRKSPAKSCTAPCSLPHPPGSVIDEDVDPVVIPMPDPTAVVVPLAPVA